MVTRLDRMEEGRLDQYGNEVPDNTPVAVPAGFKHPESLHDQIRRLIQVEKLNIDGEEMESFEEAEDFDIEDESFDPHSPYEEMFDPMLGRAITPDEFMRNKEVYMKRYQEASERAFDVMQESGTLRIRPKPAEQSGAEGTPKESPAASEDKSGS